MKTQDKQPPAAGEAAHTPTPWINSGVLVRDSSGEILLAPERKRVIRPVPIEQAEANAAFAVRACNSHSATVSLLERSESALAMYSALLNESWKDANTDGLLRAEIEEEIKNTAQLRAEARTLLANLEAAQ